MVTGSLIPQRPKKDGKLPVTTAPVSVITANDIQRLGATDLAQVLRRTVAGAR
jgi:outer membrane cobalamin receptor